MGGHYPTSRAFHGGFPATFPAGTFKPPAGVVVTPRVRGAFFPTATPTNVRPATFDPSTWSGMPDDPWDRVWGKQPYDRRGKFPGGKRVTSTPFGKKPGVYYPSGLTPSGGFGRVLGPALGFLGVGIMISSWTPVISSPAGWTVCWNFGGGAARSGPIRAYCPGDIYKNLAGQVPSGMAKDPVTVTSPNLAQALFYGPFDNPELTRMTYRMMVARPDIPSSHPNYPYPTTTIFEVPPMVMWPWFLDDDPNLWLPAIPALPSRRPRRVWDPPAPRTTYPPKTTTGNAPPGVVVSPAPLPGLEINPWGTATYTDPHVWEPPRPKTKEGKYRATGPYAALAAVLLGLASKVYNGITETVDLVSAIYSAIPAEIIATHPDNLTDAQKLPFMLGAIYQYRNQIDMAEAMQNVAANMIEDAVWGRYFKAIDTVNRSGTNYGGFDRELSQLNDLFQSIHG